MTGAAEVTEVVAPGSVGELETPPMAPLSLEVLDERQRGFERELLDLNSVPERLAIVEENTKNTANALDAFLKEYRFNQGRTVLSLAETLGADDIAFWRIQTKVRALVTTVLMLILLVKALGLSDVVMLAGNRAVDRWLPAGEHAALPVP